MMERGRVRGLLTSGTAMAVAGIPLVLACAAAAIAAMAAANGMPLIAVAMALVGMAVAIAVARVTYLRNQADRNKDEFLAILGHELRNPLAALRTAAAALERMPLDDPRLQRLERVMSRQTVHMGRLLDDLLDTSRVMRGKITLYPTTIDLVQLVREVVEDRVAQVQRRGLSLELALPSGALWVSGDRVRLAQIIDNLLSNAIKFTDAPGSITVSMALCRGRVCLAVRDTGVGMSARALKRIFEPFHQISGTRHRTAGGLGLGLPLAQALVELHHGEIHADSDGANAGSTFTVRLPIAPAPAEAPSRTRMPLRPAPLPCEVGPAPAKAWSPPHEKRPPRPDERLPMPKVRPAPDVRPPAPEVQPPAPIDAAPTFTDDEQTGPTAPALGLGRKPRSWPSHLRNGCTRPAPSRRAAS